MSLASSSMPTAIQPKPVNPYQAWLRGVPVKWLMLQAVAPFTLLFGLLEVLFHQLGWELWKFDSLLVNEAETINDRLAVKGATATDLNRAAIPTNAWHCGWESWPV